MSDAIKADEIVKPNGDGVVILRQDAPTASQVLGAVARGFFQEVGERVLEYDQLVRQVNALAARCEALEKENAFLRGQIDRAMDRLIK